MITTCTSCGASWDRPGGGTPPKKCKACRVKPKTGKSYTIPRRELGKELIGLPRQLPMYRGDCMNIPRPCPYVTCRYNLFLSVSRSGGITFHSPGLEPHQITGESCTLDVANRGSNNLPHISKVMHLTKERVRQLEASGLKKVERAVIREEEPNE